MAESEPEPEKNAKEVNENSAEGAKSSPQSAKKPAGKSPKGFNPWSKPAARKLRANGTKILFVILILIFGIGGGVLGGWIESNNNNSDNETPVKATPLQKQVVTSESQLISQIAKTVGASVVSVDVTSQQTSTGFFGFAEPTEQQSAGTGIILSSDGLIITNRHVVPAGTTNVSVTLSDGTVIKNVKVVGRTSDSDSLDIAFLKITNAKGHKLTPVSLGDSSKMAVGDEVVAIGNALGQFQNTVTSGIISGYGRSVQASEQGTGTDAEQLTDLFQTDAAINEGNSGGPLVNMSGQVIGINTAIAGNAQNIGFAIPINDVKGLIKQVENTGKLQRPYLGVRYLPLTADVAYEYNLKVDHGAYIAPQLNSSEPSIVPGSPADKAGLKEKDIITQIDGVNIDQKHSLISLIDQHQVGDTLNLTVVRGDKTLHINVQLAARPDNL